MMTSDYHSMYTQMAPICRRWRMLKQSAILLFLTSVFVVLVLLTKESYMSPKQRYLLEPSGESSPSLPIIYAVTPTFKRTSQMADLTRLAQTLMLVPNLYWLVVEDAPAKSFQVADLLKRTGLPYTHLYAQTPAKKRFRIFGKGVRTRLEALKWLRKRNDPNGVIYFADDDNSYDIRVFEEMRWTQKLSVWPVGLINKLGVSTPVVRNGKVVGFHDPFVRNRLYRVDMAGFAVASDLWLRRPNATFPYKIGYLEDHFLRGLDITLDDMEPKANNCTVVLVWHTKTMSSTKPSIRNMKSVNNYSESNLPELYKTVLEEQVGKT